MSTRRFLSSALHGATCLAVFAGCSSAGTTPAPPAQSTAGSVLETDRALISTPGAAPLAASVLLPGAANASAPDRSAGFADPDAATKTEVVVSDGAASNVQAYTSTGTLTAKITGLFAPEGLAADGAGDIYVANTQASDIVVYKNDYKTHILTLNDPNEYPTGVDIDDAAGLAGVTNIFTTSNSPGSVSFYATADARLIRSDYKYISHPCVTVTNGRWAKIFFGSFDKFANFYIDGTDANGAVLVGVVSGGCKAKAIITLGTANALQFPGAIHVSTTGQIAVEDQKLATVYTYAPKLSGSLGKPVSSTTLKGAKDPVGFSLTKNDGVLWVADASGADVFDVTYPAGGVGPQKPISGFKEPIGVVVTPVATP